MSTTAVGPVPGAGAPPSSAPGVRAAVLGVTAVHAAALAALVAALVAGHPGALALAGTAYLLGLRHALDADHIAVIDSSTRHLTTLGAPARTTGLWFSLGHSAVVVVATAAGWAGLRWVAAGTAEGVVDTLSRVGTVTAAVVLSVLAVVNGRTWWRQYRRAEPVSGGATGLLTPVLRRLTARTSSASGLFPVGLLMGLGLDTATSVTLLVLSAGADAPVWTAAATPLAFAAGMSLLDTSDGVLMSQAYGFAALGSQAARRRYNLTVTGVCVVAASVIGMLVWAGLAASTWPGAVPLLDRVGGIDTRAVGVALVVVLGVAWGVSRVRPASARRRPDAG
ncbi:hypothetical protein ET495_14020 [Xylanimonas allomyrinae]|uniref:Nickel/cobalt efflux system n=1 Tax=Xylanimonas allomyrinae TaxID=2509459 RepID=A0A4P6ERL4_9MICO|nr:hypothetical protein [Xylanimonas allomyrinae]QAY64149.1 hypothetical protein ET495_14020 [Xylanimonas allomyrinae]